jgi:hypothetical protein
MSKSSTTAEKLAAAIAAVQAVSFRHRAPFVNLQNLRSLVAERKGFFEIQILSHPAPWPLDLSNGIGHAWSLATNVPQISEFLKLRHLLTLAEAMPQVAEADSILAPLVAEVRRLESQLAEETDAAAAANRERQEALAAAEAEALEKVRAKFAIVG